jgi:hypothetical protein
MKTLGEIELIFEGRKLLPAGDTVDAACVYSKMPRYLRSRKTYRFLTASCYRHPHLAHLTSFASFHQLFATYPTPLAFLCGEIAQT